MWKGVSILVVALFTIVSINVNKLTDLYFTVHDGVCYHPDDIGRCLPSADQSCQTFPVDIYIIQLFYIFQHIP